MNNFPDKFNLGEMYKFREKIRTVESRSRINK